MREIKFRAFYGGKMYRVNLIDWDTGILELETTENDAWEVKIFEVELMQFTGLLDKNGKEIYEGDVFEEALLNPERLVLAYNGKVASQINAVVSYIAGCYFYCPGVGTVYNLNSCKRLTPANVARCQIIGNLYENPELLNPKHENNL